MCMKYVVKVANERFTTREVVEGERGVLDFLFIFFKVFREEEGFSFSERVQGFEPQLSRKWE